MTFSLNDPEVNISPLESSINSSNRDGLNEETRVLSSAFVSLIILYTFQYIVSYMIIDIIEQKRFEKMLKKYQDKPDRTIYAEFNIMDSFYDVPDNDKKYLCDTTYEKIDKPTLKKNKLSDSLGKIGFVIIDDYH